MKERKIDPEEAEGEKLVKWAKDEISRTFIPRGVISYAKLKHGDMPKCWVLRNGTLMVVKRESTKNYLGKGKKGKN
jgi:hypothetical protein